MFLICIHSKHLSLRAILLSISFLFIYPTILLSNNDLQDKLRVIINLNDYISNDYINAVDNNQVIDESEYAEMLEFSKNLLENFTKISAELNSGNENSIIENIILLQNLIEDKSPNVELIKATNKIKELLLAYNLVQTSPEFWPNIAAGKLLYATNCANCHGELGLGNGVNSLGLNPAPTNFSEAAHLNPFHIYNTVQLGIEGTSMAALPHLTNDEKWNIAFYVQTLTLNVEFEKVDNKILSSALQLVNLSDVSQLNNQELFSKLGTNASEKLKAIRFFNAENEIETSLLLTKSLLTKSYKFYTEGNLFEASNEALNAYFTGFEPVERKIIATNSGLVKKIEGEMLAYRATIAKPNQDELALKKLNTIFSYLDEIDSSKESNNSFLFVFIATLSILIREGLEALLIIVAILSALRAMGAEEAKKYVHAGWITAVFIGIVGYFFTAKLIAMGAQSRELIEGLGALLAVVILLSVGLWLHDKSTAAKWQQYVKSKIQKSLNKGSFAAIGLLGFVVVFREAFESVIFLSALTVDGETASKNGVLVGTLVSAIIIIAIGILIVKYSKKLPVHKVFKISSIAMMLLAVVLAGKGIKELQEAGFVSVHLAPFNFSFDFFGIYPTYETLGAQLFVALICFAIVGIGKSK